MDRRSWLWRRKSSEKSPGETESSGSVSSVSERYSDDQDASKASPNHAQSPEVSSNVVNCEDNDTVKSLSEKLSAALLNIRAKEDLVKQHAKVAEEAVSGWEKADTEVATLKQQLETATQKSSALEDRISQLDGALKECVRQLRQSRVENEQKVHNAIVKKTHEWESDKFELETRLAELEAQLEVAKEQASISIKHDLQAKLEAMEKENSVLKIELLTRTEELNIRTIETELSIKAAETASKQHLESIKKVTKLESECRKLRALARRTSSNDYIHMANSVCIESLTDSQSDSGERFLNLDNEPSCSDTWASALIAELDQFKGEKAVGRNPTASSIETNLMDDFLEMERLAALPESKHDCPCTEPQVESYLSSTENSALRAELDVVLQRTAELEEKVESLENEKAYMEMQLTETHDRFEISCTQLKETEGKLVDLQRQLDLANSSNQVLEMAMATAKAKTKASESQLESADSQVQELREKIFSLEGKVEEERVLSAELALKCFNLEDELSRRKREAELRLAALSNGELKAKQEKELAVAAGKFAECQKTITSLGQQLKSLATLEDFMMEFEKAEVNGGSQIPKDTEINKLHQNASPEIAGDSTCLLNGKERHSPPCSSSSSSSSLSLSENGKSFSRSRSNSRTGNSVK